jgi:hypothetical protein
MTISRGVSSEITTPHIAAPDVHVDAKHRRIVMYFHGLDSIGHQVSRVAISRDGIDFTVRPEVNQLRDPAAHEEAGVIYLLHAVGGESGIAVARVDFTSAAGRRC